MLRRLKEQYQVLTIRITVKVEKNSNDDDQDRHEAYLVLVKGWSVYKRRVKEKVKEEEKKKVKENDEIWKRET